MKEYIREVPDELHDRFRAIVSLTDTFCEQHLNAEYKDLTREMAVEVCRRARTPVSRGKPQSWACGIVYSVGWVNFLTDSDTAPHMPAAKISEGFGVSGATMMSKARTIREELKLMPFDPSWCLTSLLDENPLVWMHEINGMIVDLRSMSRAVQLAAYEHGYIPYIYADRHPEEAKPGSAQVAIDAADSTNPDILARISPDGMTVPAAPIPPKNTDEEEFLPLFADAAPAKQRQGKAAVEAKAAQHIFELRIELCDTEPVIWRQIAVSGQIPLDRLHDAIQLAMGWENGHLHQFIRSDDECYGVLDPEFDDDPELLDERNARLSDLVSRKGDQFFYEYDFRDRWDHVIEVISISEPDEATRYPICTAGARRCPPEDCGGVYCYADLLEVQANPKHERHEELLEWLDGPINPDEFNLDETNHALRQMRIPR